MSTDNPQPPARQPQHNGWTPERQQRFLDHLADVGSVAAAARAVGMTRQSAYWVRRQPWAAAFASSWDAALAGAGGWIEQLVMDRIVDGEEEVIEREGCIVEVRRRPCDVRLLLFHLKRQEDRRSARAALEQAVVLRRLDRQAATVPAAYTRPDASKASKLREDILAMHRQESAKHGR
ncbi:hypothetical protein [Sandarakinorhabdus sp.]|uniref:hypothetical protein n=1 Tax=Sandarakinorhabdus sp. TaxID=1916663 RepID=UPI00286E347A|nr:hypothetical protein [Sandarakinorhabdus sp.]